MLEQRELIKYVRSHNWKVLKIQKLYIPSYMTDSLMVT